MSAVEGVMRWIAMCASGVGAVLIACAPPAATTPPQTSVRPAAFAPTPAELRRDLTVFASDSFRGRETGTEDERRAASFLIERVTALGLDPEGDSGFVQRVPLVRSTIGADTRFAVHRAGGPAAGTAIDGLVPVIELGDGSPPPRERAEGDLVFVGYGVARHGGVDDLAKVPITGRVVVVVNGAPAGADAARRAELESPAAIGSRLQRIVALRPAGVIVLLAGASADEYEPLRRELAHGVLRGAKESRGGALTELPDSARRLPLLLIGLPTRGSPLLPRHWPHDDRPQRLDAGRFTGVVDVERTVVHSYNVVAGLRGADPDRQGSWVAFSAHYDHLGVLPAQHGDSIAHGADDDGSGSVALLAVARVMSQAPRPRRSVLFVWHTGEEEGLLGSAYFAAHPTVPLDSIVALVNADMIGRNAPDSLYLVGPGAAPNGQSRALGVVVDSVNAALAPPFALDRDWDTPASPERIYYRSDAYQYAARGVPIVFFTSGLHSDYHQVSDRATRIDYTKLAHVGQLLYALGEALADRDASPR